MLSTLLAVGGTLAGSLVTGLLQHRLARSERLNTQAGQTRSERLDAVTALAVALSDHRRAMWERRDAELSHEPAERVAVLREESHRTRSAITAPAVRLRLLVADESVQQAADMAVAETYALRTAPDTGALQQMRQAALEAHDHLVTTAGAYLTTT
jgi:hypothetical protein